MKRSVLIILPEFGFDPSEAAIPWQQLRAAGEQVVFATPHGRVAAADPHMVSGEGLDWWGWAPALRKLKLVGLLLRANREARSAYRAMVASPEFQNPLAYAAVDSDAFDALLLPGGHIKDMRPYLEDEQIQGWLCQCLEPAGGHAEKPVAAVCHGVLPLARARGRDGRSLLYGRKVTALPWSFEKKAWQLSRIFRFWDPNYYRTYLETSEEPVGYWSVEAEIKRNLREDDDFLLPRAEDENFRQKTSGMHRDTKSDGRPAWVVQDNALITARWPGDLHLFSSRLIEALGLYRQQQSR